MNIRKIKLLLHWVFVKALVSKILPVLGKYSPKSEIKMTLGIIYFITLTLDSLYSSVDLNICIYILINLLYILWRISWHVYVIYSRFICTCNNEDSDTRKKGKQSSVKWRSGFWSSWQWKICHVAFRFVSLPQQVFKHICVHTIYNIYRSHIYVYI